jgi:hypothetical protein
MQQRAQANGMVSVIESNNHQSPPRKFARGRVCAEPGCTTHLSVYNGKDYCSLHRLDVPPRTRGQKKA